MCIKKYSDNNSINKEIANLLTMFDPISKRKMEKAIICKFRNLKKQHESKNTTIEKYDSEARHIFREFIIGAKLNEFGYNFEYEKNIENKTPDWIDENQNILIDSYTYERSGRSDLYTRLTDNIEGKCNKYRNIIKKNNYKFIVSVYIDFYTSYSFEDIKENSEKIWNIFNYNSNLWGIIFFTESYVTNKKQNYDFVFYCKDDTYKILPFGFFKTENISKIHDENKTFIPKISSHLKKTEECVCEFKYHFNVLKQMHKSNSDDILSLAKDNNMTICTFIHSFAEKKLFKFIKDDFNDYSLQNILNQFQAHSKVDSEILKQKIDEIKKHQMIAKSYMLNESTQNLFSEIDEIVMLFYGFINHISCNVGNIEYGCFTE
jgi:hypothetical protein